MSDVMYKMPLDMLTRRYYKVTSDCTKIGDPIPVNKVFQTMLQTDKQLPLPTCGNSFGVLPIGFLRKVGHFSHVPRYSIDGNTISFYGENGPTLSEFTEVVRRTGGGKKLTKFRRTRRKRRN
jgi:hypothetical protein